MSTPRNLSKLAENTDSSGVLGIASGGTGSSDAASAKASLGLHAVATSGSYTDLTNKPTTAQITENTNLYYTDSRVRAAVSASGSLAYNSSTGVFSYTTPTTTGITEGTNLYYTDARARGAFSAGTGISYNSSSGVITSTITQYTDSLARGAVSASGSLAYNSSTGVFSYTTPSTTGITEGSNLYYTDARARAAISASTGLSYNSSTGVFTNTITQYTDSLARGAVSATGSLSYNSSTGVFSYTTPTTTGITEGTNLYYTDARARAAISVTGSGSYNSTTGVITVTGGVTSVNTRTGAVTLTSTDVGLGSVENKSSATIRSEITSSNVTAALGFTPYNSTNPSGYISGITSSNVTTALGYTPENSANRGVANGYASLNSSGQIPSGQLPSYVDDVLEAANLASFPVSGETGKIYVALDTNKTYRWSGSAYVYITSGAVDSVAGKTGVVSLTSSDVGLGNVENKSSSTIRGEITSSNVTTALGYTPYNSTNPSSYITTAGARSAISVTGSGSYDSATGVITVTGGVTSVNSRTGAVTVSSSDVTGALGFTPYNATNPSGYITSSALSGYLTSSTAASTYLPLSGGTMTAPISFSNVVGNKLAFYYVGSDKYGIDVQSDELRIFSGAQGASTGGITFGKHDGTTFTEAARIRNNGTSIFTGLQTISLNHSTNTTTTGSHLRLENPTGSQSLIGFTFAGVAKAALRSDSDGSFILNSAANNYYFNYELGSSTFSFRNGAVGAFQNISGTTVNFPGTLQQGGNQVLHAGNYSSYALPLTGGTITGLTVWNTQLYISGTNFNTLNSGYGAASDGSDIWLNYRGYNDGFSYFRNFNVGNGKGTAYIWGDGANLRVGIAKGQIASYTLDVGGIIYTNTSSRAPIFYDSDDTGYYLDPASTSKLLGLTVGDNTNTAGYLKVSRGPYNQVNITHGSNSSWGLLIGHGDGSLTGGYHGSNVAAIINVPNAKLVLGTNNTAQAEITTGGSIYGYSDVRAPIFYDSDNTGYYVNPASTSQLYYGRFKIPVYGGDSGVYADSRMTLSVGDSSGLNSIVYQSQYNSPSYPDYGMVFIHGASGGNRNVWSISPDGPAKGDSLNFLYDINSTNIHVGTTRFRLDGSGNSYSQSSARAPIFYDSNDTSFYVNPNDLSSLYGLNIRGDVSSTATGNQIFFWSATGTTTSAIGFKANGGSFPNPTGNGDGYNTYLTMDTDGRGWVFRRGTGGTDFTSANNSGWILNNGVWQANASMRAPIFYDSDNTGYYVNPASGSNGVSANFQGRIQLGTFNNSQNNSGEAWVGRASDRNSGTFTIQLGGGSSSSRSFEVVDYAWSVVLGSINSDGNSYASSSYRAPIFYDRDDTGYYVDPNNTSTSAAFAGNILLSGILVRRSAGTGYLSGNYSGSETTATTGAIYTIGGSYYPTYNSLNNMYGIGYTYASVVGGAASYTSSTSWGLYTSAGGICRVFLDADNGKVLATGDIRAPIYYDSNDTGYYVNPNSTSNFAGLTVSSTITGNISGNSGSVGGLTPNQFFNNMGNGHSTYTDFNNVPNFGAYYVQQGGSSPTGVSSHQWYGLTLGLGNDYPLSSYGSQFYYPRAAQNSTTYIYIRDREGGSWGSWRKIYAGWADAPSGSTFAASGDLRAPIFYDSQDTGYYVDPNSDTQLNYVYARNWFRAQGNTGFYLQDSGRHLYKVQDTYGSWDVLGYQNSYAGIRLQDSNRTTWMHDTGGNGGWYNYSFWIQYWSTGNSCLGIGTSSTSSSYRMYVDGSIYATGNITAYSDARKKTNIITVDNALDKVSKLRGVYYNRIDSYDEKYDTEKRQIGVIAQEVNLVLPEVVTYAKDVDEYGVQYGNMAGLFIEAIKEMKTKIEALEQEIKILKGKT